MFGYGPEHWLAFATAAALLNLSPGPDIAFILGKTAQGGRRAGLAAMLGVWTGTLGHVGFAVVGLSALLVSSAIAFTLVKWVGAGYLVWLGVKALRSGGTGFVAPVTGRPGFWPTFRQGMLVNLLNPKVAVFMLAFLPQFVVAGVGPVPAQLALHGVMIIVIAGFIEPPLVLAGDKVMRRLRDRPGFGLWLDRTLGAVLIALGLKLATSRT
ncbi:MAG: LysE family translocator [Maritimibacter sp.]|nr:LysE family translocator [Maritimibacter sp.]